MQGSLTPLQGSVVGVFLGLLIKECTSATLGAVQLECVWIFGHCELLEYRYSRSGLMSILQRDSFMCCGAWLKRYSLTNCILAIATFLFVCSVEFSSLYLSWPMIVVESCFRISISPMLMAPSELAQQLLKQSCILLGVGHYFPLLFPSCCVSQFLFCLSDSLVSDAGLSPVAWWTGGWVIDVPHASLHCGSMTFLALVSPLSVPFVIFLRCHFGWFCPGSQLLVEVRTHQEVAIDSNFLG